MATKKQQSPPLKKEEVTQSEEKKLSKDKIIGLIIAFVSLLIIVYVAFLGMGKRPISKMTKEEALTTLKTIYGSSWIIDEQGVSYPLASRGQKYEKIFLTTDLDREKVILPIFLYLDKTNEVLGKELGFIYYDEENSLLKAHLPNSKIYDLVYSKSKNNQMENIAFIFSGNQRTYYIKEELVESDEE